MQKIVFWLLVVLCSIGGLLARKWRNARMVLIDNPTGHTIAFTLDNKEYSLLPFRQMTISLINGEHTLIMDDEVNTFYKSGFNFPKSFNELVDTLHFTTPIEILNPTRSPYVVGHQIYTDGTLSEETMRALRPKYTCPSGKNRWTYCLEQEIDALYFETVVDYALDEQFPEEIELSNAKTYELRSKLFRPGEYVGS